MGGLTLFLFALRFFVFTLYESPKFLMGRGNDVQAAKVVHKVAEYNRQPSTFTVEQLQRLDTEETDGRYTTASAAVGRSLERFRGGHIRALFRTRELAYSTSLILVLWFIIVGFSSWYLRGLLNGLGPRL